MGLFGREAKPELTVEPIEEEPQERHVNVPELPKPLNTTIIAEGITLTGDLQGDGVIHVEGTIQGEVKLEGRIVVAPTGVIRGPVEATAIQVAGSIEGDILAHDQLRLERTGVIDGDITTASFVIEDGGCLNGRTSMVKRERDALLCVTPEDALQFGPGYKLETE